MDLQAGAIVIIFFSVTLGAVLRYLEYGFGQAVIIISVATMLLSIILGLFLSKSTTDSET